MKNLFQGLEFVIADFGLSKRSGIAIFFPFVPVVLLVCLINFICAGAFSGFFILLFLLLFFLFFSLFLLLDIGLV